MSYVMQDTAANSTTPLAATVVGIADNGSGEMRVQTSAPHLFGQNDFVQLSVTIAAVLTAAYGTIVVIDSTHFDVLGSTFTATGTGTAFDLSLTPQILVPTDGDTGSLQLSGMLSALRGLADRTQALRTYQINRQNVSVTRSTSGSVPIPPWATAIVIHACGGGGGGGGGDYGNNNVANMRFAGSGGAGAERRSIMVSAIPGGATSIDVVIGAGGAGGSGGGRSGPTAATAGADGSRTTLAWHDGSFAGFVFGKFLGGAGGGSGSTNAGSVFTSGVGTGSTPAFVPGGRGPAEMFRLGPAGLLAQKAPGAAQAQNLEDGTGAWDFTSYTDPIGSRMPGDGGASMANGHNPTYVASVSYDGAPSATGQAGGSKGSYGTADSPQLAGAGGGGGGGGGYGDGGDAGDGGDGNNSGAGTAGGAGTSASANTGGGGGGGGSGGGGSTTGGDGGAGGAGGSGLVQILFIATPST